MPLVYGKGHLGAENTHGQEVPHARHAASLSRSSPDRMLSLTELAHTHKSMAQRGLDATGGKSTHLRAFHEKRLIYIEDGPLAPQPAREFGMKEFFDVLVGNNELNLGSAGVINTI